MEVALSKSLSSFNKSFNKSLCFYIHSTRTSPPGAVGAVGHPFGQSRLSASAPRMHRPFGASSPPPSLSPGCPPGSPHPLKIGVRSLGWTTFSSRNRSMTNPKKYFPNSSTGSHYVSALRSMHCGGTRTSNLPLNSLANLIIPIRDRRKFLHHMLL